ncbi:hypothetical protein NBRC3257_0081 [Gluconobacter thailandicus NBRC 3257]|uniref:Transposase n=1 Tax=Gluconobacter thailandicus NBRC 3257 TaxID=1381097 RepID=A0ABQ0ISB4_GLUTH|nr:hypothetical protein NBRC3255_0552 [Gluconobacter thailandicus NBRC 3255]GAD25082.1 hypothetical protein NBRC3257_0081 [Gluconobacter thailandicus NBRC 3257]
MHLCHFVARLLIQRYAFLRFHQSAMSIQLGGRMIVLADV